MSRVRKVLAMMGIVVFLAGCQEAMAPSTGMRFQALLENGEFGGPDYPYYPSEDDRPDEDPPIYPESGYVVSW